ncbi:MAG: sensor histidine kinase [Variibacter sp.]
MTGPVTQGLTHTPQETSADARPGYGEGVGGPWRGRARLRRLLAPLVIGLCATSIFILDTVTELEIAAAVLYVAVVLMAVRVYAARGVVIVSAGCVVLTILSHLVSPGEGFRLTALANCVLSVAAIVVTAVLALRNQAAFAALHQARAQLAHVNRLNTLGELTAAIAHEVNQPLAGVVTNANACLRWLAGGPQNTGEVRAATERIISDGNRASAVIQRIRALARNAPLQRIWLDMNAIVVEVDALVRHELAQQHVLLHLQLDDALPRVYGDRVQLQQVVLNLVMNAIEAVARTGQGGGEIVVSTERAGREGLRVVVRDNGPGFAQADIEKLFEAFFTTKAGGMGMGLAICRTIIEAHGGALSARANTPRGAVFIFSLPAGAEDKT